MEFGSYILGKEILQTLRSRSEKAFEREYVEKLNWASTAHLLVNANLLLSIYSRPQTNEFVEIQRFLAHTFFSQGILSSLRKQKFEMRVILFRQQMLTLLKKVFRIGRDVGGKCPNEDIADKKFLGRALINMNDFLAIEGKSGLSEVIIQLAPTFELYTPPWINEGIARTLEYLRIFDEIYPDFHENQSLDEFFKNQTGIGLNAFLEVTGALYAYYLHLDEDLENVVTTPGRLNLSKSVFFEYLRNSEVDVESYFKLNCLTMGEFRHEIASSTEEFPKEAHDFSLFRKFPLVYLTEDIFTCIDFGFLAEKVSFGFYRTVFNSLPVDPKQPNQKHKVVAGKLSQYWGNTIEAYVNSILRKVPNFHPNVSFSSGKGRPEQIDGVVIENKTIAIIEVKGRYLSAAAKYSGSQLLIEQLDQKFGRKSEGGIYQLVKDIELLFGAETGRFANLSCPETLLVGETIYPVLIADESTISFDLVQEILRSWFFELIADVNIRENVNVEAPLILPIDVLERLEPYLINGDFTLVEFIDFYQAERRKGLLAYQMNITRVLNRFLEDKEGRQNHRVDLIFSQFLHRITSRLNPLNHE